VLTYIEATREDILLANQLAHAVLGRSLDELPPGTRRLLSLIEAHVERAAVEQGTTRERDAAPRGRLERVGELRARGRHRAGRQRREWRPAGAGATVWRMSETLRLTVVYEDGGDGWIVASIPEVPGAHSQGHTRAEARENVIDALQTMLTPDEELQEPSDREALIFTAQT
jgi:predicted RNase H-like HicB family nuclease